MLCACSEGSVSWLRQQVNDDNVDIARELLDNFRNFDFWRATGGVTFRL
jgi:hypothetical protein